MTKPNFFVSAGPYTVNEIAEEIGAQVLNFNSSAEAISVALPIETAGRDAISFLDNTKYLPFLNTTNAGAVICSKTHAKNAPANLCILVHNSPYRAYAKILRMLFPDAMRPELILGEHGISSAATIGENFNAESDVVVEAGCIIGNDVSIGKGSWILAGAIIGSNVKIGRNTTIGARAVVSHALIGDNVIIHNGAGIGQDGFGFAMGAQGHKKVPQIGRVIVQDKVEVGANTTIDRGSNRNTIIGEGCKIDNLVQIGHNVVMGRHCVIVGLVGISGSTTLGDFVVVGGQAGIVGHVNIGSGAQIGGGSGVQRDIEPGEKVMGYPSIPADLWMRQAAKNVREAKKQINERKARKQ